MALEIGLDGSFGNMYDWKGMRDKAGGIDGATSCVTIDKTSVESSTDVALVHYTEHLLGNLC
jgi:hypothetical protein